MQAMTVLYAYECNTKTTVILFCNIRAWCSGESCLTESSGRGFEAASPQILRGKGLPRFFPSPDPTRVGASGTGSALNISVPC